MVLAGTPARARSPTLVYGRPAMIFFAVAGPTPGSAVRSFSLAVLRSTGAAGAAAALLLPLAFAAGAAGAGPGANRQASRAMVVARPAQCGQTLVFDVAMAISPLQGLARRPVDQV